MFGFGLVWFDGMGWVLCRFGVRRLGWVGVEGMLYGGGGLGVRVWDFFSLSVIVTFFCFSFLLFFF